MDCHSSIARDRSQVTELTEHLHPYLIVLVYLIFFLYAFCVVVYLPCNEEFQPPPPPERERGGEGEREREGEGGGGREGRRERETDRQR